MIRGARRSESEWSPVRFWTIPIVVYRTFLPLLSLSIGVVIIVTSCPGIPQRPPSTREGPGAPMTVSVTLPVLSRPITLPDNPAQTSKW